MCHFFEDCWKLDDLSMLLDTQSSIIRKHVTFWIAQGIIKEVCKDTFAVVYQKNEFHKGSTCNICIKCFFQSYL